MHGVTKMGTRFAQWGTHSPTGAPWQGHQGSEAPFYQQGEQAH